MNNTDLTKRQLRVNPGAHEQHGPNQKITEGDTKVFMNNTDLTKRQLRVNSGAHEQHGPNQKTTGGEPMCSGTTRN